MTDIWRSFVAQRCVWELNGAVTFHAPEVVQDRNQHNLLRDFQDEVPGYLANDRIRGLLQGLSLAGGRSAVGENLQRCYELLVAEGIFPKKELCLVKAWRADLEKVSRGLAL
ncbi:MAG: STELLO glycosyltransferase family protein [Verrucomicrobia bacterium]|nr:STELLO glycosyltransferase family protein [Verrucomicrobiota bacterium]